MNGVRSTDFDVVVVGSGAAGLAAVATAGRRGARVLVVESENAIGGSSRLSDAMLQAAGTAIQRRDGIDDTAAAMFSYYMTLNRWQLEPGLARAYCADGASIIDWLLELGLQFGPIETAGIEPTPRGHPTIGAGEALIAALDAECRRWSVELALANRVEDVARADATSWRVRARGEDVTAAAVVLAAGGFARSPEHIRKYLGGRMYGGDHPVSPSGNGSLGDALTIGERLGAGIAGRNRAHWVPGPMTPSEAVLLTADGRRFINESLDHSVRTAAAQYHGQRHYAIFDETIRRLGAKHPFVSRTPAAFLFTDEPFRAEGTPVGEWVARGALAHGATLHDAAESAGLAADAVVAAVDAYNDACASGVDVAFEKDPRYLIPIRTPPFYVLRVELSMLVATFCGLRIDAGSRVLDVAGRPIAGLFAAGESAGGVVGDVYGGHGNSVTTSLVFGRRAGAGAASAMGIGEPATDHG